MKCDSCGTTEGKIENDGASGINLCSDDLACDARKATRRRMESGKLNDEDLKKDPLLQFFRWEHLTAEPLRVTSSRFASLALTIVETSPRNPERTVALRKLLEAKDCGVRSHIFTDYSK